MKTLLEHFGETQHYKNLIYLLLISTLCTLIYFQIPIPEKFWDLIMVISGVYFVSGGNRKNNNVNNSGKGDI